jgi:hypothetical protein
LQQRILLLNDYRGLSDRSFNQLVSTMIQTATIPVLGTYKDIIKTELKFQQFDCILVDDAHNFNQEELQQIARMANKLVLIGEMGDSRKSNKTDFSTLVDNTFPAYRVKLSENFRLHPQLAYKVFNYFYGFYPYSPLQRYSSITNRLCWFDATTHQAILQQVLSFLNNYSEIEIIILTFSTQSKNYWKSRISPLDKVLININDIKEFIARECDAMVIIFDDVIPNYDQLRLAFTRAKEIIACFGDRNFYEIQASSPLRPLFLANLFHIIRDVSL